MRSTVPRTRNVRQRQRLCQYRLPFVFPLGPVFSFGVLAQPHEVVISRPILTAFHVSLAERIAENGSR